MSGADDRRALAEEVRELRRSLESLRQDMEPGDRRRLRPPSIDDLRRFTAEVSIPAAILVLETNIRALQLLQRALRLGDGETGSSSQTRVADGAAVATREALSQLERTLTDLGDAVTADPGQNRETVDDVLERARTLRTTLDEHLEDVETGDLDTGDVEGENDSGVPIDVEAELEDIKAQVEDGDDGHDGADGADSED